MGIRATRAIAACAAAAMLLLAGCADDEDSTPAPSGPQATQTSRAPFTPPPGTPKRGTQSGLAWDSGVFHNEAHLTQEFAHLRGRPVDVIGIAPTRDTWKDLLDSWWLTDNTIPPGYRGTLNVALPLFPEDGSMERAASGADDAKWEQMGRLIASKYPTAYVRPGWEMNIENWPWRVTEDNVEQYKTAFRHASTALKKGGPQLRIVFNPNEGKGNSLADATKAYPGDDVVDIIGIDAYDWSPPYDDERAWHKHRTQPGGWDFWGDFARSRGKMFAVPEWGVIAGSPDSGGDNPEFINRVMGWMNENADIMAFDTYFDEREDYCRCSLVQNPQARQAYLTQLENWAAK
ncbi:glycosyl hydrolase [Mobilicoccus sp.]|uniref:glycoside hydrolase family 26 protein n=1 Tax=Mobilicoccus sp. TaxID=2034349 RepID=UPI00289FC2C2|nr:glycosyl hydrolase [Mobilicoccus sp.]